MYILPLNSPSKDKPSYLYSSTCQYPECMIEYVQKIEFLVPPKICKTSETCYSTPKKNTKIHPEKEPFKKQKKSSEPTIIFQGDIRSFSQTVNPFSTGPDVRFHQRSKPLADISSKPAWFS